MFISDTPQPLTWLCLHKAQLDYLIKSREKYAMHASLAEVIEELINLLDYTLYLKRIKCFRYVSHIHKFQQKYYSK